MHSGAKQSGMLPGIVLHNERAEIVGDDLLLKADLWHSPVIRSEVKIEL
jgi:hypothetical protein